MRHLLERLESRSESDEISAEEIILARLSGDLQVLNEASLGRVYQHFKARNEKSLGIVTAYRHDNKDEKNKADNKTLESMLKSWKLGFFKLRGRWVETKADGEKVQVSEPSYGVPGMTLQQAQRIRTKFKQDAVIYMGPETDGMVGLLTKGGSLKPLGKFHPNKIAKAYSEVRGSPFIFEWLTQSWGEAMLEQTLLRKRGLAEPSRSV